MKSNRYFGKGCERGHDLFMSSPKIKVPVNTFDDKNCLFAIYIKPYKM